MIYDDVEMSFKVIHKRLNIYYHIPLSALIYGDD